jgi:hypothetical protein
MKIRTSEQPTRKKYTDFLFVVAYKSIYPQFFRYFEYEKGLSVMILLKSFLDSPLTLIKNCHIRPSPLIISLAFYKFITTL